MTSRGAHMQHAMRPRCPAVQAAAQQPCGPHQAGHDLGRGRLEGEVVDLAGLCRSKQNNTTQNEARRAGIDLGQVAGAPGATSTGAPQTHPLAAAGRSAPSPGSLRRPTTRSISSASGTCNQVASRPAQPLRGGRPACTPAVQAQQLQPTQQPRPLPPLATQTAQADSSPGWQQQHRRLSR